MSRNRSRFLRLSTIILLHLTNYILIMKKLFSIFVFVILFGATSCQSRVVSPQKPLQTNSLELYQNYTILTNAPAQYRVQVLKQDADKIYTKTKQGEELIIAKSDIREVKKTDLFSSIAIGLAAIAAVIFVPI